MTGGGGSHPRRCIIKWFKLDSDWYRDPKIQQLADEYGPKGLLMYVGILSALAERYSGDPTVPITISLRTLSRNLHVSVTKLSRFCHFCEEVMTLSCRFHDTFVTISYDKFLIKQHKYFASSVGFLRKSSRQLRIKSKEVRTKSIYTLDFEKIWSSYPKKIGKKPAFVSFQRAQINGGIDIVLKAIENQKGCDQWKQEGGKFIPLLASWLNQERWEDEIKKELSSKELILNALKDKRS